MSTASPSPPTFKTTPYYPPPTSPLPPLDDDDDDASAFARADDSLDAHFYTAPRLVTHIDDAAIARLTTYYDAVLPPPSTSSAPPAILDLCTSWVSHYPPRILTQCREGSLRVYGIGMNAVELRHNPLLQPATPEASATRAIVHDLNIAPRVSTPLAAMGVTEKIAATTCTVSIDYLTQPHAVLTSLREATREGGAVHLAISNRCFPTKAVARWVRAEEGARVRLCCEDLWRAGWRDVAIVEITDGGGGGGGWQRPEGGVSLGGGDSLWVVRGRNVNVNI